MAQNDRRITVRLLSEDVKAVDGILSSSPEYSNRSDLLRAVIRRIGRNGEPSVWLARPEGSVPVDKGQLEVLDFLVSRGHFASREAALFEMIRDHLERIDWDRIERRSQRSQDARIQLTSERMTQKRVETELLRH